MSQRFAISIFELPVRYIVVIISGSPTYLIESSTRYLLNKAGGKLAHVITDS